MYYTTWTYQIDGEDSVMEGNMQHARESRKKWRATGFHAGRVLDKV